MLRTQFTAAQVRDMLSTRGFRVTRQRLRILDELFSNPPRHLTAEQLHQRLVETGERVSLSRVYGTLNMLCAEGLLRRLPYYSGTAWYELTAAQHQHYYIEEDGHLLDIPEQAAPRMPEIEVPDGYVLVGIDVLCRLKRKSGTDSNGR